MAEAEKQTHYIQKMLHDYGNLRWTLYEAVFEAREVMRSRMEMYGEWTKEYELAHARFSALYTVIEDVGMEEDYQAWKKKKMQKEGTTDD